MYFEKYCIISCQIVNTKSAISLSYNYKKNWKFLEMNNNKHKMKRRLNWRFLFIIPLRNCCNTVYFPKNWRLRHIRHINKSVLAFFMSVKRDHFLERLLKLKVSKNKMIRKIFVPKRNEGWESIVCRILYN